MPETEPTPSWEYSLTIPTIFDGTRVHADTLDAASALTQPSQVELYARAFERLSQGVVRGAAARSLIAGALSSLD